MLNTLSLKQYDLLYRDVFGKHRFAYTGQLTAVDTCPIRDFNAHTTTTVTLALRFMNG